MWQVRWLHSQSIMDSGQTLGQTIGLQIDKHADMLNIAFGFGSILISSGISSGTAKSRLWFQIVARLAAEQCSLDKAYTVNDTQQA